MKKVILTNIAAAVFALTASQALAASGDIYAITGQTAVSNASTAPINCVVLSQPVTLNASADVNAAIQCVTGTSNADIAIAATCHVGGSTKDRAVQCTCTDDGAGGFTAAPTGCTCDGAGTVTGAAEVTVSGRVGFGGSSNGGAIAAQELGAGNACTAANVQALSLFQ